MVSLAKERLFGPPLLFRSANAGLQHLRSTASTSSHIHRSTSAAVTPEAACGLYRGEEQAHSH